MTYTHVRGCAAVTLILLSLGCGADRGKGGTDAHAGPRLVAVDSILLAEADTLYLGNPYSLATDPFDGSFYVSDFFADRVFRFDRDGSLRMRYGRPGSGPGEFTAPSLAWVLDSRRVAAAENDRHVIHLFDRESGRFERSVPFEGRLGRTAPITLGGMVWMPSRNRRLETSVLGWDTRTDSTFPSIPLPDEYLRSFRGMGRYGAFFTMGSLAGWSDTLMIGMSGVNHLVVATTDGRTRDTLHLPVVRRRGVPHDIVEMLDRPRSAVPRHESASSLAGLFRHPDGSFVLVHHDASREGEWPNELITARVFVSAVSADRTRACVDAELPVSQDARPIHGFNGDTLFLLDRRIHGETMQTWIVSYLVDTDGCAWLPTRR